MHFHNYHYASANLNVFIKLLFPLSSAIFSFTGFISFEVDLKLENFECVHCSAIIYAKTKIKVLLTMNQ